MTFGSLRYRKPTDLPAVVPVFPLPGVLLLPRGNLPLNIFEPRYLAMVEAAFRTDRLIVMVQPRFDAGDVDLAGRPPLCEIGCVGLVTAFQETQEGRCLITLTGISRVKLVEEMPSPTPYRLFRVDAESFASDFVSRLGEDTVDRDAVIRTFRAFLDANDMEADWNSVDQAGNETLVNALSMMSPYGPPEKQALLEADSLKKRADTLIAITEMTLAHKTGTESRPLN